MTTTMSNDRLESKPEAIATTSGTGGAARMIPCDSCGHMVPEMNLTIHKLHGCQSPPGTSAPAAAAPDRQVSDPMDVDPSDEENDAPTSSNISPSDGLKRPRGALKEDDSATNASDVAIASAPVARRPPQSRVLPVEDIPDTPQQGFRRRRRKISRPTRAQEVGGNTKTGDDDIVQVSDMVDLVSPAPRNDPMAAAAAAAATIDLDDSDDDEEEKATWSCPKCTLLNQQTQATCAACEYRNPDIVRPPDPTSNERLVDDDDSAMSPLAMLGGGALLGSMLGAAGNAMTGRDLLAGAAEGALSGAVGGVFLQDVLNGASVSTTTRNMRNSSRSNNDIAQARSSAAMGLAGYPSLTAPADRNGGGSIRARPRASYRVVRQQGDNGASTTIVTSGGSTTRITSRRNPIAGLPVADMDPLLSMMLHSALLQGGGRNYRVGGGNGVDQMNYEELLRAFGDGTENMGAQESQVRQLPTKVIEDPEQELPEDARQCLICLEEFGRGETRMTLPCLHGFHQQCADRWLRTNASCPICKHRLP